MRLPDRFYQARFWFWFGMLAFVLNSWSIGMDVVEDPPKYGWALIHFMVASGLMLVLHGVKEDIEHFKQEKKEKKK